MKFVKILQDIAYRHRFSSVYDDFLQMSICALSLGRMEEEYLDIAKRYSPEELTLFSHALGQFFIDANERILPEGGWDDMLGDAYMENVSKNQASNMGQFFTPAHICQMMAQMVNGGSNDEEKEEVSVNDCAAGSSRNLIAHCRLNPMNRFKTFYVAQDLDYTCVMMSVMNYVLFGMKGIVIHMNTLSMEIYRGYRIYLPETGLMVQPLTKEQCHRFLVKHKTAGADDNEEVKIVSTDREPEPANAEPLETKQVIVPPSTVTKKYIQTSLFD